MKRAAKIKRGVRIFQRRKNLIRHAVRAKIGVALGAQRLFDRFHDRAEELVLGVDVGGRALMYDQNIALAPHALQTDQEGLHIVRVEVRHHIFQRIL